MTLDRLLALGLIALLVFEGVSRLTLTRRVVREGLILFVRFELFSLRLVRVMIPPKFVLLGECHKRGVCCRQIVADPPKLIRDTWLRRIYLGYHSLMHNFHPVGLGPNDEIILGCRHLGPDGRCAIYRFRPLLCRNYPLLPFYAAPQLLPGCGFRVAPRVVAAMKNQRRLPIVNPFVAVHHPTAPRGSESLPEHFELVDDTQPAAPTPAETRARGGDEPCP